MTVAAFDLDGTLTKKDTFLEFIRHTHGLFRFCIGFALLLPVIVLFKMKCIRNGKAKEIVFGYFYRGWSTTDFNAACHSFAHKVDQFLNAPVVQMLKEHLEKGDAVVIVSASIENWISPWALKQGIGSVLGTKIEVVDQRVTGKLEGENCYGAEKVNRLLELYPQREIYTLVSYGDSAGDKELFAFSDKYKKV